MRSKTSTEFHSLCGELTTILAVGCVAEEEDSALMSGEPEPAEEDKTAKLGRNLCAGTAVALAWALAACDGGFTTDSTPSQTNQAELAPSHGDAWVSPPDELGPFGVGRTTFVFHDQSRNRALETNVWYPTRATTGELAGYRIQVPLIGVDVTVESEIALEEASIADGLFGLILFSHGNFAISTQSFFLTEALASHGFIVVAPDHRGNTLLDIGQPTAEQDPFTVIGGRARDISFLITAMMAKSGDPSDPFFAKINPYRIGVTGHSAGGSTSFIMAAGFSGEALVELGLEPPPDFAPVPRDPRVTAIAPISAGFSVPGPSTAEEISAIRVSTLLVTGTEDELVPRERVAAAFDLVGAERVMESDVLDAFHLSFANICQINEAIEASGQAPLSTVFGPSADLPCEPAALPIAEVHRITNLHAIAFFRYVLKFESPYLCFLTEEYVANNEPDVQFRRKPFLVDDVLASAICAP